MTIRTNQITLRNLRDDSIPAVGATRIPYGECLFGAIAVMPLKRSKVKLTSANRARPTLLEGTYAQANFVSMAERLGDVVGAVVGVVLIAVDFAARLTAGLMAASTVVPSIVDRTGRPARRVRQGSTTSPQSR